MGKKRKPFEIVVNFTLNSRAPVRGCAFLNGKITINLPHFDEVQEIVKVIKHEELHTLIDLATNGNYHTVQHHRVIRYMMEEDGFW